MLAKIWSTALPSFLDNQGNMKRECLLVSCLHNKALLMLQQCNWKEYFSISVSELYKKYIRNPNLLTRSFLELQLQGGPMHLPTHLDFLVAVGQVATDRTIHVVEAQTLIGQATCKEYIFNTIESCKMSSSSYRIKIRPGGWGGGGRMQKESHPNSLIHIFSNKLLLEITSLTAISPSP